MTFQAFIDDSGSSAPVFVLSGYISSVEFWEQFSDEWQALLDKKPKLKYLKMHEAKSGFGGRMKREPLKARLRDFFSLIRIGAQASIASVIPIELHKQIIKGKMQEAEWDDPCFMAMFDIIVKLLWNQVAIDSTDTIEFIFDDNPRLAAQVPAYYQLTRQLLGPKYRNMIAASPRFENDIEYLPLQAADAQSWYFRRLISEKFEGEPFPASTPKPLFSDLDNIPTLLSTWNRERLEYFAALDEPPLKDEWKRQEARNFHEVLERCDFGLTPMNMTGFTKPVKRSK